MTEDRLPESIKSKAKVHLGEYSWKVPDVYEAIESAASLKLAVIVGDPRIELPQGIYEFMSDAGDDEEMRGPSESWPGFVERSAAEAKAAIKRLMSHKSWIAGQDFAPKNLEDLQWVLYFLEDSSD